MKKRRISLIIMTAMLLTSIPAYAIPIMPNISTQEELETYLRTYIKENYKDNVTDAQLDEAQLKGMFDSLDPYSNYYTKEEYKQFSESLSGAFVGIGAYLEEYNGYVKITKPIPGSPAEAAGLKAGDIIVKVDGASIENLPLDIVIAKIKGKEGSVVELTVIKTDINKEVTYHIARSVITIQSVSSKMINKTQGYVALESFDTGSAKKVIEEVEKMVNLGATGIVLDLRDNPGGYLGEAIELSDFFLDAGNEIINIDYKTLEDEVIKDEKNGYKLPVVVLVNGNSASASEIVASALQKNSRAKIVGVKSYGKGTVQDVIRLPEGNGFKLTIAEYKGPNMTKINGIGITPDYIVKLPDQTKLTEFSLLAPLVETKTYKSGEVGLNVYGVQQRLNLLGSKVKLTAKMDATTVEAIKAYQKANKLSITAKIDASTKKSLEEKTNQLYNLITSDNQLTKALEVLKKL